LMRRCLRRQFLRLPPIAHISAGHRNDGCSEVSTHRTRHGGGQIKTEAFGTIKRDPTAKGGPRRQLLGTCFFRLRTRRRPCCRRDHPRCCRRGRNFIDNACRSDVRFLPCQARLGQRVHASRMRSPRKIRLAAISSRARRRSWRCRGRRLGAVMNTILLALLIFVAVGVGLWLVSLVMEALRQKPRPPPYCAGRLTFRSEPSTLAAPSSAI
jgi:hypothetical protein